LDKTVTVCVELSSTFKLSFFVLVNDKSWSKFDWAICRSGATVDKSKFIDLFSSFIWLSNFISCLAKTFA
jgi:hypothetical protein